MGQQSLLSQLELGYQLETDLLGGNPILPQLKEHEGIRPALANASSLKALRRRSLIHPIQGRDPLTIRWRFSNRQKLSPVNTDKMQLLQGSITARPLLDSECWP